MKSKVFRLLLYLLVANGLLSLGFVAYAQRMSWLPEYGQGFWWAWGSAFQETPENLLFTTLGLVSFILLTTKLRRKK